MPGAAPRPKETPTAMDRIFSRIASRMALWAGQPVAFVLALATILAWLVSGPLFQWSDTWQLVINTGTTIVTFLIVFLIQNAQNRDASAMQVKLDELIRAIATARNDYIGIEHLTDAEIGRIRDALEKDEGIDEALRDARAKALRRFIERR
jgi:low affinity Fe/Cu permease